MLRYFFHISDGRRTYPDPLGVVLPSLAAARAHAFLDAQSLSESWMALSQADWRLMVADEGGAHLLSIALSQAAKSENQPRLGCPDMLTAA